MSSRTGRPVSHRDHQLVRLLSPNPFATLRYIGLGKTGNLRPAEHPYRTTIARIAPGALEPLGILWAGMGLVFASAGSLEPLPGSLTGNFSGVSSMRAMTTGSMAAIATTPVPAGSV